MVVETILEGTVEGLHTVTNTERSGTGGKSVEDTTASSSIIQAAGERHVGRLRRRGGGDEGSDGLLALGDGRGIDDESFRARGEGAVGGSASEEVRHVDGGQTFQGGFKVGGGQGGDGGGGVGHSHDKGQAVVHSGAFRQSRNGGSKENSENEKSKKNLHFDYFLI